MFVYNRADHFVRSFDALALCPEAKDSVLFVFSDGAKNDVDAKKVSEVRSALREKAAEQRFLKTEIVESETNKGLAASVISGVTRVINEYGKVIVLEDDCVASPYLLGYFNAALDHYENDLRVGSIAGYTPPLSFPDSFTADVFAAYRSCSWGWATYERSWENVDWELKDVREFFCSPALVRRFNADGGDRFMRLYRQTTGDGSSWSVRFGLHLVKNDLLTIYPRYSYISNIGCDETGVHSKAEDAKAMAVNLSKAIREPRFCDPEIIPEIQREMKKRYSFGPVSDMKRFFARRLIIMKSRLNAHKA